MAEAAATQPEGTAAAAVTEEAAAPLDPMEQMKLFLEACREVAPQVAQVEQLVPEGEGSEAVRQSLADVSGRPIDLPPEHTPQWAGLVPRVTCRGLFFVCDLCSNVLCCLCVQARRILCDYAAKQEAAMTAAAAEGEGGCVIS